MINNDGQHGLNQLDAYSNISGRNLRAAKHRFESIQKPTGRIVAGQKKQQGNSKSLMKPMDELWCCFFLGFVITMDECLMPYCLILMIMMTMVFKGFTSCANLILVAKL